MTTPSKANLELAMGMFHGHDPEMPCAGPDGPTLARLAKLEAVADAAHRHVEDEGLCGVAGVDPASDRPCTDPDCTYCALCRTLAALGEEGGV